MGYYADTSWNIDFHSEDALAACKKELATEMYGTEQDGMILSYVGEHATENWDGLSLVGWTSGKYFSDADTAYPIIAKYAKGEVELDASDSGDGHWKHILDGNGGTKTISGRITYGQEASFGNGIDWLLLRDQKAALLDIIGRIEDEDTDGEDAAKVDALTGILHLIDHLQDTADEQGILPEGYWPTED